MRVRVPPSILSRGIRHDCMYPARCRSSELIFRWFPPVKRPISIAGPTVRPEDEPCLKTGCIFSPGGQRDRQDTGPARYARPIMGSTGHGGRNRAAEHRRRPAGRHPSASRRKPIATITRGSDWNRSNPTRAMYQEYSLVSRRIGPTPQKP